jgi:hypothetical protein
MAVRYALHTHTSIEFFLKLSIDDFFEIAKEIKDVLESG